MTDRAGTAPSSRRTRTSNKAALPTFGKPPPKPSSARGTPRGRSPNAKKPKEDGKTDDVDDKIANLQKSLNLLMRNPVPKGVAKPPAPAVTASSPATAAAPAAAQEKKYKYQTDTPELAQKRKLVLEEVISTEDTYVKEMLSLMQNYLTPMIDKNIKGVKDPTVLKKFLGSASGIAIMHAKMLKEFKTGGTDNIVKTLWTYVPFFKCYFPFLQTYPTLMLDFGDNCNKALTKFLQETCTKQGHLNISQLLILPVQRVPRYVLLLQEVLKYMPADHAALADMEATLVKVKTVATEINDCQKESENSARLFKYHTDITGIPDDWRVLTPTHEFLKVGQATRITGDIRAEHTPPKSHPQKASVRMLLFNDAIVITDWNYKYLERMDVDALEPRPRGESMLDMLSGLYADELHEGHTFLFDTAIERNEWMSSLMLARNAMIRDTVKLNKRTAGRQEEKEAIGKKGEKVEKLNVFMRIRPFITKAEKESGTVCLKASEDGKLVTLNQVGSTRADRVANYDFVFGPKATQTQIFDIVGKETLGAIFAGYNIGIFAYGNTGAGKTYTMFGAMGEDNNVIYRPPPPAAGPVKWRIGQECLAQWTDGHFYNAVIEKNCGGHYEVLYPEFDERTVVQPDQLVGGYGQEPETETRGSEADQPKDPDSRGLIPRILEWLFEVIGGGFYEKVSVKLSYLQVYNGQVHDLQQKSGELKDLPLKRDKKGNYVPQNLTATPVTSCEEAMGLIAKGNARRITRAHKMNEMSSRSHAIVILDASFSTAGKTTTSKIHLIDLAGSEAQVDESSKEHLLDDNTRARNQEENRRFLEESKHINQSLISLGRVVHTLIENQKRSAKAKKPVPFRESKLTHLLMEVLSGDFLCTLILNASPSPVNNQVNLSAKTMAFGEGIKKLSAGNKAAGSKDKTDKVGKFFTSMWTSVSSQGRG